MRACTCVLTVAMIMGLSAITASAPLDKSAVPSSSKWVFHTDFEAFSSSSLGQKIYQEIETRYKSKVDSITLLLGSNLSDLSGMTVFGPDAKESHACALIYGRFDREKLLSLLASNPEYGESRHGEAVLYHWIDPRRGKNQVGTFAADNLIVISQTEAAVIETLDVLADSNKSLAAATDATLSALTENIPQSAFFVAAADNPALLTQGNEHAAVLQNSRMISFIAIEEQEQTNLSVTLDALTEESAQQVEQLAYGMLAFASLQKDKNPDIASLAGACRISRAKTTVSVNFLHPSDKVFELIKKYTPMSAIKI